MDSRIQLLAACHPLSTIIGGLYSPQALKEKQERSEKKKGMEKKMEKEITMEDVNEYFDKIDAEIAKDKDKNFDSIGNEPTDKLVAKEETDEAVEDETEKKLYTHGTDVVSVEITRCVYPNLHMEYTLGVQLRGYANEDDYVCSLPSASVSTDGAHVRDLPSLESGRVVTNGHTEHVKVAHVRRIPRITQEAKTVPEQSFTAIELNGNIFGFCTSKYENHEDEYPLVFYCHSSDHSLDEVVGGDMASCYFGWADKYFLIREEQKTDNFDLITVDAINNMFKTDIDPRDALAAQAVCRLFMNEHDFYKNTKSNVIV